MPARGWTPTDTVYDTAKLGQIAAALFTPPDVTTDGVTKVPQNASGKDAAGKEAAGNDAPRRDPTGRDASGQGATAGDTAPVGAGRPR